MATRVVIVSVFAVALVSGTVGFLIGDHLGNTSASTSTTAGASKSVVTSVGQTGQTVTTTTTPTALGDRGQTVVVVANGSKVNGAAGVATTNLRTLGYKTLTPANTGGSVAVPVSQVFFAAGSADAAAQVISELHLTNVVAQPFPADTTQLPLVASSLQNATVVVVLGADFASSFAPVAVPTTSPRPAGATTAAKRKTTTP